MVPEQWPRIMRAKLDAMLNGRDFLGRNRVPFRFRDYRDPDDRTGEPFHPQIGEMYPLIEFPDGSRLVTPTLREVAGKLGLCTARS